MDRGDLQQLSKEQVIELVLRLQRPDKNSRTSSKPPSTDKKEKREHSRPDGAKLGHEPHNRRLSDNPDEFQDHMPDVCERCGRSFGPGAARELIGEYDEIEIPPVKPHITRHRRFACRCGHCGLKAEAPVATTDRWGRVRRPVIVERPVGGRQNAVTTLLNDVRSGGDTPVQKLSNERTIGSGPYVQNIKTCAGAPIPSLIRTADDARNNQL